VQYRDDDHEIACNAAVLFFVETLSELPVIRKLLTAPRE
jgi:hypothetical protein